MSFSAGSYEGTLYGFHIVSPVSIPDHSTYSLVPSYSLSSHSFCIKSIASTSTHLVTGASDDSISVVDIKQDAHVLSLQYHVGDVTALSFFQNKFLFSGGEDGAIMVFRTSDWERVATMKAHKKGVLEVAVHPSGKLLLSIGKDKAIRVWDLSTSRCISAVVMKEEILFCKWSFCGSFYVICQSKKIEIHRMKSKEEQETDKLNLFSFEQSTNMTCICFFTNNLLLTGSNEGVIRLWNCDNGELVKEGKGNGDRIKGIGIIQRHFVAFDSEGSNWPFVVSVSSNGYAALWDFEKKDVPIAEYASGIRFTCLAITSIPDQKIIRKPRITAKEIDCKEEEMEIKPKSKKSAKQIGMQKTSKSTMSPLKKNQNAIAANKNPEVNVVGKRKHVQMSLHVETPSNSVVQDGVIQFLEPIKSSKNHKPNKKN